MMTTMAAMLGAVPIGIGYGAGGEARQPPAARIRRGGRAALLAARDALPYARRPSSTWRGCRSGSGAGHSEAAARSGCPKRRWN